MQKNLRPLEGEKIKKLDPMLIYGIVLIAAIAIWGGLGQNSLISIVLLIAAAPLAIRPAYLIGPILFLTVFDASLIAFPQQSYGRFFVYWFIVGTLANLGSNKRGIKIGTPVMTAIILAIIAIALSVRSEGLPLSYVFSIVFFVCLVQVVADFRVLRSQLWCFSALAIVNAIYFLLKHGIEVFVAGKVGRFEEGVNSNDLAMGLAVAVVMIVAIFIISGFKHKIVNGGFTLAGIMALFLTGSRSAMIGAVCGIVVIILAWAGLSGKRMSRAIIVLSLGGIVFWIAYSMLAEYVPAILEGFTVDDVLESGGSGRVAIWRMFFEDIFEQHWLFGVGFSPDKSYLGGAEIEAVANGAHNILVEILASMGIIGLLVYTICFLSSARKMWKGAKIDMAVLAPLAVFCCCVANGIGENMAGRRLLWMALGIGIAMANMLRDKQLKALSEQGDSTK